MVPLGYWNLNIGLFSLGKENAFLSGGIPMVARIIFVCAYMNFQP